MWQIRDLVFAAVCVCKFFYQAGGNPQLGWWQLGRRSPPDPRPKSAALAASKYTVFDGRLLLTCTSLTNHLRALDYRKRDSPNVGLCKSARTSRQRARLDRLFLGLVTDIAEHNFWVVIHIGFATSRSMGSRSEGFCN